MNQLELIPAGYEEIALPIGHERLVVCVPVEDFALGHTAEIGFEDPWMFDRSRSIINPCSRLAQKLRRNHGFAA